MSKKKKQTEEITEALELEGEELSDEELKLALEEGNEEDFDESELYLDEEEQDDEITDVIDLGELEKKTTKKKSSSKQKDTKENKKKAPKPKVAAKEQEKSEEKKSTEKEVKKSPKKAATKSTSRDEKAPNTGEQIAAMVQQWEQVQGISTAIRSNFEQVAKQLEDLPKTYSQSFNEVAKKQISKSTHSGAIKFSFALSGLALVISFVSLVFSQSVRQGMLNPNQSPEAVVRSSDPSTTAPIVKRSDKNEIQKKSLRRSRR